MDSRARTLSALLVAGVVLGLFVGGLFAASNNFSDSQAGPISGNGTFGAPDGLNVTLEGSTDIILEGDTASPDSETLRFVTEDGNLSISAAGVTDADIKISELTGTTTRVHDITAGATYINIEPEDKQRVDVRGDINEIEFRQMTINDGNTDFAYQGTSNGISTVRVHSLPANQRIVAVEAGDGDYLDHATSNGDGNLTLNLPNSQHTVRLVTVDGDVPEFANASPQGLISGTPSELSVDVSDGDMPSDELDVTISLDGNQIHSETITSNQTVSTSNFGTLDLEGHQWTVEATDEFGNTESQTYQFDLPTNITIRNEQNASQIITGANVTAKFFSENGDVVVQRGDSNDDGRISMRGLPDTDFVVTVDADQYVDRRTYIASIGEQSDIFVLNSSADTIQTIFQYEDRTGNFGQSNTTLEIQRAVDPDDDNNYDWRTIAGDFWGAAGEFPFTGEQQERYRLIITNRETGQRRNLGTHIPTADGVKEIIVGQIRFEAEPATGTFFDAGFVESGNLQVSYNDPENSTTDLQVYVFEQGNRSNEVLNDSVAGPLGSYTASVLSSAVDNGTTYVVQFETSSGQVLGRLLVGGNGYGLPIDPGILQAFGLSFVVFIAGLYGPRVALMGAWVTVGLTAMLMFFGWLQVPVAGLTVAAAIALGSTLYRERVPG